MTVSSFTGQHAVTPIMYEITQLHDHNLFFFSHSFIYSLFAFVNAKVLGS